MLVAFLVTLLANAAFSLDITCKDGNEIKSELINDANYMIGNWTYTYHWDNKNKYDTKFVNNKTDHVLKCPDIEIQPVTEDFVEEKKGKCEDASMPFKWEDPKVKLSAPMMNIQDSIIILGEKESWMFVDCKKMLRVTTKKVSDDVMVMINPDVAHISEMMSRKPIRLSELKCLADNVDVGKGMDGIGLCV